MKKKCSLIMVMIFIFCTYQYSQTTTQVAGIWKLSPIKILTLNTDQTFSYKKGANKFYGTYEITNTNGNKELVMHFENESITYTIEEYANDKLNLTELKGGKALTAKLMESFFVPEIEEIQEENVQEEIVEEIQQESHSIDEYEEVTYEDYSSVIFNIHAGASLTKASHQNLSTLDFSFGGSKNRTEYRSTFGYQAGINLGYKIIDRFYIGAGIEASKIGFIKYIEVTNDPEVDQNDALVYSEAKYSVIGIHLPLTLEVMAYKSFRIKGKVFASKYLNTTSQASVNVEASYFNTETQENINFLSEQEVVKLPKEPSSLSFGYGLEVQYFLTKTIGLGASYTIYNEYLEHDQRDINNTAMGLNLLLSF